MKKLNQLGYGRQPSRRLNLVYNPNGPHLPPSQQALQCDYKRVLAERHGIAFDQLMTITNMPISRFGAVLLAQDQYHSYMDLLRGSYSASNLETVMCRDLISVDWRGHLYDCDFNQMLALPLAGTNRENDKPKRHLCDLLIDDYRGCDISVGDHCYGCTAGQGSSCGGALDG